MVQHSNTIHYSVYRRQEMPGHYQELLRRAEEMTGQSYAPYSHFHVGCAVRYTDNSFFCGNNQENAVYPGGMCAERVTLFAASASFPGKQISHIAIAAKKEGVGDMVKCAPCGMCLQVMLEYELKQEQPIEVVFMGQKDQIFVVASVASCLPFSFSSKNLDM